MRRPPRGRPRLSIVGLGLLLLLSSGCASRAPSQADLAARLAALETRGPGPGTAMSGVLLHFAKLYYAGMAANGPLAEFELHEVEENLDRAIALRPRERGVDLAGLNEAFKESQLAALAAVIEGEDWNAFGPAYREAIAICNGCHEQTGRPFIVVTVPTAPPVSNQQWRTS